MNEVVRVKQKVEVFHSLSQEERLHAIVKLVVSQIFDLPMREKEASQKRIPRLQKGSGDPC